MEDDELHPAVARIQREHGDDLLETLGGRLSGSDLTALLLAVARIRAARRSPAEVLAQYGRDRFVSPGDVDPVAVRRTEDAALRSVAARFAPVTLSPVAPFGTHAAVAGVAQDNVVTTIRGSEVAADPTTTLALEAAVRRREVLAAEPRSVEIVRLAAVDRVLRAQRFTGARSFSHFSLLGLVSAGRDVGGSRFEIDGLVEHVRALAGVALSCGASRVVVSLTDFGTAGGDVLTPAAERLAAPELAVERWPEREAARGYYTGVCFKLGVEIGDDSVEVGDGGIVDWTQRLLDNRKERLMTSGLSIERLAMLGSPADDPEE